MGMLTSCAVGNVANSSMSANRFLFAANTDLLSASAARHVLVISFHKRDLARVAARM